MKIGSKHRVGRFFVIAAAWVAASLLYMSGVRADVAPEDAAQVKGPEVQGEDRSAGHREGRKNDHEGRQTDKERGGRDHSQDREGRRPPHDSERDRGSHHGRHG